MNGPERFADAEALDEFLAAPSAALVEYMAGLRGEIMILGAGGKVGPSLVRRARRAVELAGVRKQIIAVDAVPLPAWPGVKTITCDLMDRQAVAALPRVENVVFMVGRKFGSTGSEHLTWAVNVLVPHNVADCLRASRFAVFSTGCVYPVAHVYSGGSTESDRPEPVGEYAMSSLGRERVFDYYAAEQGARVVHIRLNYALELRYGVLVDIATKVFHGQPVDVTTGFMNGIWQGDCCDQVLRSFDEATSPSTILNITGPETLSVRRVAEQFGALLGKPVTITGEENGRAYLSNAAKANALFGNPDVPIGRIIEWVADWIQRGGENIGKPTHFETQDGRY
ncbi:MAG: NAD(P)-dependent oxidoreductase [Candidatus Marinimicrobia bacterium]|nr:NAD(P)-dependent oxidoreductase [Candidatus Neomarinimicrobiota bacterium]